ncbi:MAG: lysoplasmalogenase family protein [Bacillota bacterium]|nr:lysoplasmalogenase family protein [Bacillota bacterium]
MFRIIFALQFLLLLCGIIFTDERTVPTSISLIISFSFVVFAVILSRLNKDVYSKTMAVASAVYLLGNIVLAGILPLGFMIGMAIYFVAQALNILTFIRTSKELNKSVFNKGFLVGIIGYFVIMIAVWWIFFEPASNLKPITFIALFYGLWLSVMAASALSLFFNDKRYVFTAVGSAIFVASDFIAGIADIAGRNVPYKVNIVWITYVIAIGGIIYSKNLLRNPVTK